MCRVTASSSTTAPSSSKDEGNIPFLLRLWLQASRYTPTIKIAGLDFGFSFATCLFLAALKFATVQLLIHVFGWPADDLEAVEKGAASLVPILHSGTLVPSLWACFMSHTYSPSARFDVAPVWWQESVHLLLQFCTGYMMYDAIFSLLLPNNFQLQDDDAMFMFHHMVTSLYMVSTRFVGAGHQSAMICMFLGEASNPFHNMYYFLQQAMKLSCCNGRMAQSAEYVNTFLFCVIYVFIRAVLAPTVVCGHTCYDLLKNGRKDIPLPVMIFWCLLIWAVAVGSFPWIVECWEILMGYFPTGTIPSAEL